MRKRRFVKSRIVQEVCISRNSDPKTLGVDFIAREIERAFRVGFRGGNCGSLSSSYTLLYSLANKHEGARKNCSRQGPKTGMLRRRCIPRPRRGKKYLQESELGLLSRYLLGWHFTS